VVEVIHQDGEIVHILDREVNVGPVEVELDWGRRFDHMQQHTGQHLLTAVAQDRFGWATTAFHLGPSICDIELSAPQISIEQRLKLEEEVVKEIMGARPIRVSWATLDEYASMKVRSRGLPEGHKGDVRLIEIVGLDVNTCGGTHLASTLELECAKLLGSEPIRGGTRLHFVFGKRLRERLEAHEQRNHKLRTLLGRPDEGLADAVEQRLASEKELEQALRRSAGELASLYAKSLVGQGQGGLVCHHFEDKDAAFLQKAMRGLLESGGSGLVFLTAEKEGLGFFSLAAGADCQADVSKLGREVASILEGKGGGSGKQFQGKFNSLGKLGEAKERLTASIQQP
jgi:alanyl-tRNA synthetase